LVGLNFNAPPKIFVLSIESITYKTPIIELNFKVSEPVSQIFYSLDGMDNVTVSGNTTLSGLSNGAHNVTVYAIDEAGNFGASETITFTMAIRPRLRQSIIKFKRSTRHT
jgi:hypothetical protein